MATAASYMAAMDGVIVAMEIPDGKRGLMCQEVTQCLSAAGFQITSSVLGKYLRDPGVLVYGNQLRVRIDGSGAQARTLTGRLRDSETVVGMCRIDSYSNRVGWAAAGDGSDALLRLEWLPLPVAAGPGAAGPAPVVLARAGPAPVAGGGVAVPAPVDATTRVRRYMTRVATIVGEVLTRATGRLRDALALATNVAQGDLSSIPAPAIAHSPTVRDDIGLRVETGHMQATEIASAAASVIVRAWHRRGVQLDLLLQRSEDAQAQLSSEQQAVGIMQATSRVLRRAWERRGDQVDVLEQRVAQLQQQLEQADNARLRAETASDAAGNRINILEAQLESAGRLLTSRETRITSLTFKIGRLERESTKAERLLAAMQTQINILTLVHQHLRRHLQRFRALAADTLLASVADVETAQRETEEARHRAEARQTQVDVLCAAVECLRKHLKRFETRLGRV